MKLSLKKNVILTDTGSAKKEVNKIISNLNLDGINWIASHPIAGTEFSGPEAGFAELFENRWCILSADKSISEDEISKLEKFWSDLGSKVKLMSFDQHDYVLSLTSHLPHAVAYSIVKTAINAKILNVIAQSRGQNHPRKIIARKRKRPLNRARRGQDLCCSDPP